MYQYTKEEKDLIYLASFDFMHYNRLCHIYDLVKGCSDLKAKLVSLETYLNEYLGEENAYLLVHYYGDIYINSQFEYFFKHNIRCYTIISPDYPQKLLKLKDPPLVLYCAGDYRLLEHPSIAVVGSRKYSNYGKNVTEHFVKKLVENEVTIVSGLANGIDRIAHECALDNRGDTIAVMASGFDHIYPVMNANLENRIEIYGCVVTEYPRAVEARNYHFPFRNRIIAALSDGVLITEAGQGSGALITADRALEMGIDVFVVPGNIDSKYSIGSNELIKSGNSMLTTNCDEILEVLKITPVKSYGTKFSLNKNEQLIYNNLSNEEVHFDQLLEKTKLDPKTLNSCLTTMTIRGIINNLKGNYYSLKMENK